MSNHHLNHLAFYGIAISSVLVLFKVVSTYGERNLQAPLYVDGLYQMEESRLPSCLKGKDVKLDIEQSGIYLFGNLFVENQAIPLSGDLHQQQLNLVGKSKSLGDCLQRKEQLLTLGGDIDGTEISLNLQVGEMKVSLAGVKQTELQEEKLGH
jgi:hypothetical protein